MRRALARMITSTVIWGQVLAGPESGSRTLYLPLEGALMLTCSLLSLEIRCSWTSAVSCGSLKRCCKKTLSSLPHSDRSWDSVPSLSFKIRKGFWFFLILFRVESLVISHRFLALRAAFLLVLISSIPIPCSQMRSSNCLTSCGTFRMVCARWERVSCGMEEEAWMMASWILVIVIWGSP